MITIRFHDREGFMIGIVVALEVFKVDVFRVDR